jgi:hypothetical protein
VKLYEVTIRKTALVLAKDEQHACHVAKWEADDEEPTVEIVEASRLPPGWTANALVYGAGYADITAAEALQKYGAKP